LEVTSSTLPKYFSNASCNCQKCNCQKYTGTILVGIEANAGVADTLILTVREYLLFGNFDEVDLYQSHL
jgi:hypothetical protein